MPKQQPKKPSRPLPELYREKVAANDLAIDPGQQAALAALEKLRLALVEGAIEKRGVLSFLKRKKNVPGFYLFGDVGRGKTMMMDLFFANLPAQISARRVHFHEFMQEVHDFLHQQRHRKDEDLDTGNALLKFAASLSSTLNVLCFDEFHVTDIADAMILGRLFQALFNGGVTIVLTTNWPPDRLYEDGLQRERFLPFIALIKQEMDVVEIGEGPDHRMMTLKETGVYFTPLDGKAQQQADEVFARLTDHVPPHEEELSVKGRTIHVGRTAKGIARFTFSQLCEQPLGAADYLVLAKNYHTVFLESVPRLTYDRRNETKRLMTLIDALYDNKVKLVMTAAELPENLYTGHDYAFEFERTVSRLHEMQSTDYLQSRP